MISRRIVQDSDDDGSSSVGNVSPEKRKSIDMIEQSGFDNEYPEIIGEGVEDGRNGSSETNARGENYGSTGSTGGCTYSLFIDSYPYCGSSCQCDCTNISQSVEKFSCIL